MTPLRTSTVMLLAALFVGCRAGTSLHGTADVAQWTPVLEATALTPRGGSSFDLVDTGGVTKDDALWALDVSLQVGRAANKQVKAQTFNFGYWGHRHSGSADLGATGIEFAGKTLTGATRTSLDLKLFKFTYGEPQAATGGGNNRTEGTIGLHYMDFDVKAVDAGGTRAGYDGNAPMFVLGWKIAYTDRAMVYFLSVEGMDLDVISLENIKGKLLDYSTGIRWSVGTSAALSLAYRDYDAQLDDRGEKLKVRMAGAYFSLFVMW